MNPSESFARYSMAGWAFVVVLLASLAFSPDQHVWNQLTRWLSGSAGPNQTVSGIAVAAFGIIAGVSAPPALGYVLARAAAGVVENVVFYLVFTEAERGKQANTYAIFFSRAATDLITWREGRTTQVYASLSCALAGLSALLVAAIAYRAWSLGVLIWTLILAACLLADAWHHNKQRNDAVQAWLALPDADWRPPS